MIRRFLRRFFCEELEELQAQVHERVLKELNDSIMIAIVSAINENAAALEKSFIELGLLERNALGGLQARPCPAMDLLEGEQVQLVEQREE